jgi:hypothetical protein
MRGSVSKIKVEGIIRDHANREKYKKERKFL